MAEDPAASPAALRRPRHLNRCRTTAFGRAATPGHVAAQLAGAGPAPRPGVPRLDVKRCTRGRPPASPQVRRGGWGRLVNWTELPGGVAMSPTAGPGQAGPGTEVELQTCSPLSC